MLRIPDRFWWLQRIWGVLLILGALGSMAWLVIHLPGSFNFSGLGIGWQVFIPLLVIAVIFLVVFALGALQLLSIFVQGIGYFLGSSPARDRFRRWLLAIQGDQDAMPRATINVDPGNAPNLSSGPLELLWRPTLLWRFVVTPLLNLIFLPLFGFLAGLGIYLAYSIVTDQAQMSPLVRGGLLLLDVGLLVVGMSFIVIALLSASLPAVLGKSHGMVAGADGILYRPSHIGRSRFLRWEEMRLFEVEQVDEGRPGRCRLYGPTEIIQWLNQPPANSLGVTKEEFEERHQALLNLIVARTDLLPRTLDKSLAVAEAATTSLGAVPER